MSEECTPNEPQGWSFLGFSDLAFWQASHIAHSIGMVGSLPALREDVVDSRVSVACTEAWLLHSRLLAEFLAPGPPNLRNDVTSATFGWACVDDADRSFLTERKNLASKYLVHLSTERFPDQLSDFEYHPVTLDYMLQSNARLFEIFDQFLAHLHEQGSPVYVFLSGQLDSARAI
jgi:hypothetical protein